VRGFPTDVCLTTTSAAHSSLTSSTVEAIVTLVTSVSRPPILLTAIEKILKRKYAGAVNLDTVVDLLSPDS
jgi:hypothetical protein